MTSEKLTAKERLLAVFGVGSPEGFKAVVRFCGDVQEGRNPDPEFLDQLATAFVSMLREPDLDDGRAVFAKQLDLHGTAGRRGKDNTSSAEAEYQAFAGWEYLRLKKEYQNSRKPRAVEIAADEISHRYDGVHPNTIKNWAKNHAEQIRLWERMVKNLEQDIKARVSDLKNFEKRKT